MKAHKVPATYLSGWEIPGHSDRIYIFDKAKTSEQGTKKKYRDVDRITTEHSFFMEEDFYYIDFSIKGIAFKLKNEITDFLAESSYTITSPDDLNDKKDIEELPSVEIDTYAQFIKYLTNINVWSITDADGSMVSSNEFKNALNDYIFNKVGVLIEEDYFSHYLENMWNDVKKSIIHDVESLTSGNNVTLSRKNDLFEFFVVQYLRVDKRMKADIEPTLQLVEDVLLQMGITADDLTAMKEDGLLSPEAYFFGALLDAARGDKRQINKHIQELDKHYALDVLEAPEGLGYLTSTSPCIISKTKGHIREEFLFPINSSYCLRLKIKDGPTNSGKYFIQSENEIKAINRCIVSTTEDIVISDREHIVDILQ